MSLTPTAKAILIVPFAFLFVAVVDGFENCDPKHLREVAAEGTKPQLEKIRVQLECQGTAEAKMKDMVCKPKSDTPLILTYPYFMAIL